MTLAFVLGCPIGYALELETTFPPEFSPLERALVVGTDSRFLSLDGALKFDHGAKVWHLEPGISAVFAGFVSNAELGLGALKRRLARSKEPTIAELANWASECFRNAVPAQKRAGPYTTQILIGVRTTEEMATIRLESIRDFDPLISTNAEIIGAPEAQAAFIHHLGLRIAPVGRTPRSNSEPREEIVSNASVLHGVAVSALMGAIQDGGETVGGPIQTGILSAHGTETRTILAVDPDWFDGNAEPAIERISARPEEVRTLTGRDNRRLLAMGASADHETVVGLDVGPDNRLYVTKSGWLAPRPEQVSSVDASTLV